MSGPLRRRWWLSACSGIAASTLLVILLATRDGGAQARQCRSALIPAYVSADEVAGLAGHAHPGRLLVINPNSGPGKIPDRAYRQAVALTKKAGARVLGYVPTGYGSRDLVAVEDDVDRYRSWYGVDGIFLDEASSDAASLSYYGKLARHIRSARGSLVVLNPGVVPARGYFDIADVVVTFEGPVGWYAKAVEDAPTWLKDIPAGRIAHLVYGASHEQALRALELGAHAGYFYATVGLQPHPWFIPDYMDEMETLLARC